MEAEKKKDVLRETDAEAIRLARTLVRSARFGALAGLDPLTGAPVIGRVGVATDIDGTPLILVSGLSAHTRAIAADPRCALMVGEPGKGDALAHPRISLACRALRLERGSDDWARAERRYLNRNPKAKLYVGLGDFAFHRLELEGASLNGGFGKAYAMTREHLLSAGPIDEFAQSEQGALDHMNEDHFDAIANYAAHWGKASGGDWKLTGIDPDGIDLVDGDRALRIFFDRPMVVAKEAHINLVQMAKTARAALGDNAATKEKHAS